MPDFEALIRHQQLKQPKSNKRLKLIDDIKSDSITSITKKKTTISLISYLSVGFLGAILGGFTILFLDINNLIPIELLKLN